MSAPSSADLLACMIEAVRRAGDHAKRQLGRRMETIARSAHDVKLALDLECQTMIESVLTSAYPAFPILGEEGSRAGEGGYRWIVDPLDGTVNFSHGLPYWCHSVAVQQGAQTVAGAVYAPLQDELFAATADGPATCNGRPITVSDIRTLDRALLLTGLEKNFEQHPQSVEVARAVALASQKMRLMGAAALDLCYVACGRADGFYESGIHLWDVAAGELIVQRAGGRCVNLAALSEVKFRYVATNGHIHDELMALLRRYSLWMQGA